MDLVFLTLCKELTAKRLGSTWMQKQLSMWQEGMLLKSLAAVQLGEGRFAEAAHAAGR